MEWKRGGKKKTERKECVGLVTQVGWVAWPFIYITEIVTCEQVIQFDWVAWYFIYVTEIVTCDLWLMSIYKNHLQFLEITKKPLKFYWITIQSLNGKNNL